MLFKGQNTFPQTDGWMSSLVCGTFSTYLGHGCSVLDEHDKKYGAETESHQSMHYIEHQPPTHKFLVT